MDTESPWLTRAETARYLKVSPRTVDRWADEGKLVRHHIAGLRSVRFHRDDCDKLLISEELAG